MIITIEQIKQAITVGYPVYIVINGQYYEIDLKEV